MSSYSDNAQERQDYRTDFFARMKNGIVYVSVVRNLEMYDRCFTRNPFVQGGCCVKLDNTCTNQPIPVRYNAFLDSWDYRNQAWFVFCHEDFEVKEPDFDQLLMSLRKDSIYGPIGSVRKSLLGVGRQRILGRVVHGSRDDSRLYPIGARVQTGTPVDTFDCCCLMVHSSLVKTHGLRFDEELEFDLYVEDFCAMAHDRFGIVSRIADFSSVHHSGSAATDRLYRHLPYLMGKYKTCHSGVLVYFGRQPLAMRIQKAVQGILRL